jgi:3-phosphoshikimate 1-carboxyvinyltransferase
MKLHIKPSSVNGTIDAPASKSYLQRAIMASSLCNGTSILDGVSLCDDSEAVLNIAKELGATIEYHGRQLTIKEGITTSNSILNCHESGLALRMLSPIVALFPDSTTITGSGSLLNRPIDMISDALMQLKVAVTTNNGKLPITIGGNLQGGTIEIEGSKGSQLLTGLLMALPMAKNDSKIIVRNLKSKPYIEMTLEVLKNWDIEIENTNFEEFFIKGNQQYIPANYIIEGDWSGAAFMLVAGAIAGNVTVNGLQKNSKQADAKIVEVLNKVGAVISFIDKSISIQKNMLNGFDFDATDCPDLFPPLVALAVHCNSTSTIAGVSRLFTKESNRAETLVDVFTNLGVDIRIQNDSMIIEPSTLKYNTINAYNDHRIAMAVSIAALRSDSGVEIDGFECINKSYPEFYNDLKTITQQ